MNRQTASFKKSCQISSVNFQNNKGQLRQLELFVIDLARLWFSGENSRREVDRNLNVKFGYFNGCRASLSINNMFSFILFYKSSTFFII